MLVAQWTPPSGVNMGPLPTGPAYVLLGVGAVAACLGAGLLAMRERKVGQWFLGLGLSMAALGTFALLVRHSEDQSAKDGLHAAAETIAGSAVASALACATQPPPSPFAYPSGLLPGGGTTFTPPACHRSPRDQVSTFLLSSIGPYRAQEAASFATTGEVTVTDPRSGAQVCATVPADPQGERTVSEGACP